MYVENKRKSKWKICSGIKRKEKIVGAYFTVEAALVMPIVFMCYLAIIFFMCYVYERCVWEQNACRLSVWIQYVEGYAGLYPGEMNDTSEQEICRYVQACLKEEEESGYLFGENISAAVTRRGDRIGVERELIYTPFGECLQTFRVTVYCPEPMEYMRTTDSLQKMARVIKILKQEAEADTDDKE